MNTDEIRYYPDRVTMMAKEVPFSSHGVEIGVQHGDLAAEVVRHVKPARYWLVDPWMHVPEGDYTADPANVPQGAQNAIYEGVCRRFADVPSVTILRKKSIDALEMVENRKLDWVYIDGDHTYKEALSDLAQWACKVKKDGVMFVHDYCVNGKTIKYNINAYAAVETFLATYNQWQLAGLTEDEWTTAMLRRRNP